MRKKNLLRLLFAFLGICFICGSSLAQNSGWDSCIIGGIFYQQENPVAMIGDKLYKLNDAIAGGIVAKISTNMVTIKFEDGERGFGIGQSVCQEVARKVTLAKTQKVADNLEIIVSAAKSFSREFYKLITTPGTGAGIKAALDNSRQQLAKAKVPAEAQRLYLLAVKTLDIGEDAYLAAVASEEKHAEVLSVRLKRVLQELDAEYSRVSP